jgi:hypothetical protein
MILIDVASLVTAPKEARPQALFNFSSTKAEIAIIIDRFLVYLMPRGTNRPQHKALWGIWF